MAHFAQLDENNVVLQVIVVNNVVIQNLSFPESEPVGVEFCQSLYGTDTVWKQTSYNAKFRSNYAVIGGKYDPTKDEFCPLPELQDAAMQELKDRFGVLAIYPHKLSEAEMP
jgi:hypothetical protein